MMKLSTVRVLGAMIHSPHVFEQLVARYDGSFVFDKIMKQLDFQTGNGMRLCQTEQTKLIRNAKVR